ncbi:hypothetical protein LZ31DRAFT_546168 [Colletotrichum somersetense]|nr:hypothetical protein LZ31DRAFT_546168 [Colletotrichum somersetense]
MAAPSWSWVSLPVGLAVRMSRNVEMRARIEPTRDPELDEAQPAAGYSFAVARGASVRRICVKAPLRKLWGSESRRRPWPDVHVPFSDCSGGDDKFRFANPREDVHAADSGTARLMAYEARKKEIVVELDYINTAVAVAEGRLEDVYCLAVSERDMLLLSRRPRSAPGVGPFRRIGVTFGYRKDFFKKHGESTIVEIE